MATYEELIEEKSGLGIGGAGTDIMSANNASIQIAEAYKDLVNKVATADPNLLDLFVKKISSGWSNNTYQLHNHYILSVWRKGDTAPANVFRQCRKILQKDMHLASVSGSIYEATEMDPVFFIEDRLLKVIPDHTVNSGEFQYIGIESPDSISNANTYPAQPITDGLVMPQDYCMSLVLYVAIKLVEKKLSIMNDSLSTMIDEDDAPIVPTLVGEGSPKGGWEVVRYYIHDEEDPDLSGAKIQELGAEMQQWVKEYEWYQERLARLKSDYLEPFASLLTTNAEGAATK